MNFDLVITNPPFQNASHGEKKNTLWRKFIEKSISKWTISNGYICLITPSSWFGSRPLLAKMYPIHHLIYLNKDECKKHFPGIGSSFSAFTLAKGATVTDTKVVNQTPNKTIQTFDINLTTAMVDGILPRDLSVTSIDILNKLFSREKMGIVYSNYHHTVHKQNWNKEKSEEFCYSSYSSPTAAGLKWFKFAGDNQTDSKIIIPTTTYYHKLWYVEEGATCQSVPYYVLQEEDNAVATVHNLKSKIMCWANDQFRYSNWNNSKLLTQLPKVPTDRTYDDEEMFDWFGLNDEERDYVG